MKKVGLAFAAATLALLSLELGSRVWLTRWADDAAFRRYATPAQLEARRGPGALPAFSPHRYLGYYPTPGFAQGKNRHNALGYRGDEVERPKAPGEFRIVCLGGSTTYTSSLRDYRLGYPHLLQQELRRAGLSRVTVVNAGSPGWSSLESLVNLELRVLDLEPDLIIVYHGVNDIEPRLVWPPDSYRGDNSGKRAPASRDLPCRGILDSSTLLRIVAVRLGRSSPPAALRRTVDPAAPTYHGDLFLEQKRNGTYPEGIFARVPAQEMLRTNRPTYFRRNLENLVAVARAQGVTPLLTTFAHSPHFPRDPAVSSPEFREAFAEMNAVVGEVAARTGAPLFDFAAVFPTDRGYFVDGVHVSAEGARLMAKLFARHLLETGLVRPSPGP